MKNIALIGTGRIGSIHFRNLLRHPAVHCKYVASLTQDIAQNFVNTEVLSPSIRSSINAISDDITPILKDSTVDGVMIATPSPQHYSQILSCLEHKKPVFCEKPLCETIDQIDHLYQVCNENNLPPIMVGYQRRFDKSIMNMYNQIHNDKVLSLSDNSKDKIESQLSFKDLSKVSGIQKIISISRDPTYSSLEYLTSNMNCFYDSLCHDIDTICWMAGNNYPTKVFAIAKAVCKDLEAIGDYDRVFVTLDFENVDKNNNHDNSKSGVPMIAMVDWCRHSGFSYDQRISVLGYNGMLTVENDPSHLVKVYKNEGTVNPPPKYFFLERYDQAYKNELDMFVDIINGKYKGQYERCTSLTTHASSRNLALILKACNESAKTGEVVQIDYGKK